MSEANAPSGAPSGGTGAPAAPPSATPAGDLQSQQPAQPSDGSGPGSPQGGDERSEWIPRSRFDSKSEKLTAAKARNRGLEQQLAADRASYQQQLAAMQSQQTDPVAAFREALQPLLAPEPEILDPLERDLVAERQARVSLQERVDAMESAAEKRQFQEQVTHYQGVVQGRIEQAQKDFPLSNFFEVRDSLVRYARAKQEPPLEAVRAAAEASQNKELAKHRTHQQALAAAAAAQGQQVQPAAGGGAQPPPALMPAGQTAVGEAKRPPKGARAFRHEVRRRINSGELVITD